MATKPSQKPRGIPTYKGLTPLDICEAESYDPFVAQIRLCKARVTVYNDKGEPKIDPRTGEIETKPFLSAKELIEANRSLMDFVRPRMRTQEVKEQLDVNFSVTIKNFVKEKMVSDVVSQVIQLPETPRN